MNQDNRIQRLIELARAALAAPPGRRRIIIASLQLIALFWLWTPDQLALAVIWTFYCVFAPALKERRFNALYKDRFAQYQAKVPYMIPRIKNEQAHDA